MNLEPMDTIHDYIKNGRIKNIIIKGYPSTRTFFHNINENTKLKYLIIVFTNNSEKPISIYNQHIDKAFYNISKKLLTLYLN